jgi:hypothetical protein
MGFLVAKDPPFDSPLHKRKTKVPGVIGSNIFQFIRRQLVSEHGKSYLPEVMDETHDDKWVGAVAMYESIVCETKVKPCYVVSTGPEVLPARSVKVIDCTSKSPFPSNCNVIVEPYDSVALSLPNGIAVGRGLVMPTDTLSGLPVQIVNFADHDIHLSPRTPVGVLQSVESVERKVNVALINEHEAIVQLVESEDRSLYSEDLKNLMFLRMYVMLQPELLQNICQCLVCQKWTLGVVKV